MKKIDRRKSGVVAGIVVFMLLTGCSQNLVDVESKMSNAYEELEEAEVQNTNENNEEETTEEVVQGEEGIDVDLTTLSSTMVYAEVYNMYLTPEDYVGKSVKMTGELSIVDLPMEGKVYFSVIIQDALGCCSQGIEFDMGEDYAYPDDYPELGSQVTVVGEFEMYQEGKDVYCRLKEATFR